MQFYKIQLEYTTYLAIKAAITAKTNSMSVIKQARNNV